MGNFAAIVNCTTYCGDVGRHVPRIMGTTLAPAGQQSHYGASEY
jgi:hypothetical protein